MKNKEKGASIRCDECFWASPWKEPYAYGVATFYSCTNPKSKHYKSEVARDESNTQCFTPKGGER